MRDFEVDIQTADGAMNTFVTHPDEGGPHPTIVFLMDAPGKREELHAMARRIGTAGYAVVLPNLYYREVREFNIYMEGATRETMFGYMNNLSNAMVNQDIHALLNWADHQDAFDVSRFGTVGYCMSGPFAFAAANHFGERCAAAASLHGVRLCTDAVDSPHLDASEARGELYFGCAEHDDWAPPEMIDALGEALQKAGANYRIEWYPGTHHGFVFPDREGIYEPDAAERHWERLISLYRRNLG